MEALHPQQLHIDMAMKEIGVKYDTGGNSWKLAIYFLASNNLFHLVRNVTPTQMETQRVREIIPAQELI